MKIDQIQNNTFQNLQVLQAAREEGHKLLSGQEQEEFLEFIQQLNEYTIHGFYGFSEIQLSLKDLGFDFHLMRRTIKMFMEKSGLEMTISTQKFFRQYIQILIFRYASK